MITWLYTLPCFVVPFMFTINTDGLALLLMGSWENILWTNATALLAVVSLGAGIGGWLFTAVRPLERAALILAGMLLFYPAAMADLVGIALFAITGGILKYRSMRAPETQPG